MALITCRECSNEVSDSAPSCPRCGAPSPGGVCSLAFVRPTLFQATVTTEVLVDGQPMGRLRSRGRLEVPVSAGQHHVEVRSSKGKSAVSTVTVTSGEVTVTVNVGALGGPKLS